MRRYAIVATSSEDVIPELPAFPLRPAVGALIDWNDELRRLFEELKELSFCGSHMLLSLFVSRADKHLARLRKLSFMSVLLNLANQIDHGGIGCRKLGWLPDSFDGGYLKGSFCCPSMLGDPRTAANPYRGSRTRRIRRFAAPNIRFPRTQ